MAVKDYEPEPPQI